MCNHCDSMAGRNRKPEHSSSQIIRPSVGTVLEDDGNGTVVYQGGVGPIRSDKVVRDHNGKVIMDFD